MEEKRQIKNRLPPKRKLSEYSNILQTSTKLGKIPIKNDHSLCHHNEIFGIQGD
jgi:hypothetical protein